MLMVTENAAILIKGLSTRAHSAEAGLRIHPTPDSLGMSIEIAASPQPTDAVVEIEGARVFVEASTSALLADRELDALVDQGSVQFVLRDQL